ncbi:MAG: arylsulfatase [Verrucomicrobia bacterium]|nr:arylsulfatase [Verrucomicrobiota bacterium]
MKTSARSLCIAIVAAFLCLAGLVCAAAPNVIIVLTDDQGYGDFSCHGNPIVRTPHIDRLHAESVRLTDFHVMPMCTPTRGQLLTGRDCLANGAMNVSSGRTFLRRELPTIADIFGAAGYRCGQFGKWHLGDNYPFRPQDRGFHEALFYPSSHIGSAPDFWNNHYLADTYQHNGRREKFTGYTTDVFFDEAMKWMKREAAAKKPFLCYIPLAAAHGPLFVPEKYRAMYENAAWPANMPAAQRANIAKFFGMIANIDDNMGRLEAFLRETGLRENTILVFMTDNGGTAGVPVFNAGMRGRKIDLYEGGHRVPCFVRWPAGGLRAAGDVAELTTVQDILPTLAEFAGVALPRGAKLDGLSLASLLRGKTERLPERSLVIQFSRMQDPVPKRGDAAVLRGRWRLVADKELYDLASDPAQATNVIEQNAEVAARLRADYAKWWDGVAPRLNEFSAVIVGSDAENPVQLSPADWEDAFLDQGSQIRAGLRRNGPWNVEVARAGEYRIELRRWAREAATPIAAGLERRPHAYGVFVAGVALPVAEARLRVGGFDERQKVSANDQAVVFTAKLPAGRTKLQTWFLDAEGKEIAGAYYVYVERR